MSPIVTASSSTAGVLPAAVTRTLVAEETRQIAKDHEDVPLDDGDNFRYWKDQVILPEQDPVVTVRVASWLARIQTHGFSAEVLRAFISEEVEEDDETWWDPDVVRVFDPYYDLSPDDIELVVDGKSNQNGVPLGACTLKLHNGDEVYGTFRKGLRQGRGSISGANMNKYGLYCVRGSYKDGVLSGEGRAILCPSNIHPNRGQVTLEGIFNDGYLEGPVRGLDEKGNVVFIGLYRKGLPFGPCWLAREGQGWLHGVVSQQGRFSGEEIVFVYPDLSSCIVGSFQNEKLLSGRASQVVDATLASTNSPIVCLEVRDPFALSAPTRTLTKFYSFSPSDRSHIPCDWHLADCYESVTVVCRSSQISGAGDGLFALKDIPKNTIVSYYNGIRVLPGESYSASSYSYQIYVDWTNTDDSPYIDIPMGCVDISSYFASLAHKANHSFRPNCRFVASDHPRYTKHCICYCFCL